MAAIAFIGIGKMGSRMAALLVAAGHDVRVFDPAKPAVDALAAKGASAASSPAAAADGADYVLTSLPTPRVLTAALCGDDGVLAGSARAGATVVDFSTVDPSTTRDVAARCATRGLRYLDSPVSGGVIGAETGRLVLMVGGDEGVLAAARPVLDELAAKVVHCGPVGAGQLIKLSHNLLTAINTVALGEVLAASVKAGARLDVLVEVLGAGLAGSKMLDYLPKTLFSAERPPNFAIDLMHKDISLCLSEFGEYPMPLGQIVRQAYNTARAKGLGGRDSTSVNELYEDVLGVELRMPART